MASRRRGTFKAFAVFVQKNSPVMTIVEIRDKMKYVKSNTSIPNVKIHVPALDTWVQYEVLEVRTNYVSEQIYYTLRGSEI